MAGIVSSYREPDPRAAEKEDVSGPDVEIEIGPDGPVSYMQDGAMVTENDDDTVTLDFNPQDEEKEDKDDSDHDANLAEILEESVLDQIATDVLQGIEEDLTSRSGWAGAIEKAMDMLGIKITDTAIDTTDSGTISKVHSTMILEAIINYQADFTAEMLPAKGPVKTEDNQTEPEGNRSAMADALERDLNHYLTDVDKAYYPDSRRMAFIQCFMGMAYKKVYSDPVKDRPVSRHVSPLNLIVSNDITTISDCNRITHSVPMRQAVMKRLQKSGFYRELPLETPNPEADQGESKIRELEGTQVPSGTALPQDAVHKLYESYIEVDLTDYGAPAKYGHKDGLFCPYRVTIDRTSRKILELRRNWKKDDEQYCARERFVEYVFVPGLGYYAYGVAHLLAGSQRAATAMLRILIDTGMFSSFPGWLQAKAGPGQNRTNQINVKPGSGAEIDTGGLPIKEAVMELPYKEPSATLFNTLGMLFEAGKRMVGAFMMPVGEGTANIPVGTILAMIEQSTKPMAAIHKSNHMSQQHEFQLLKELFAEDPTPLAKFAKTPARLWSLQDSLQDINIVPASDPNTPSNVHRIMRAWALGEIVKENPAHYDVRKVERLRLQALNINPDEVMLPPPPPGAQPPAPPSKLDEIKLQAQVREAEQSRELQQDLIRGELKNKQEIAKITDNQADRQHDMEMQRLKMAETANKEKGKFMSGIMGILKADKSSKKPAAKKE
jgi:hypothetical protein